MVDYREIFNSWYQMESLIKSGKLNIEEVLTHEFKLEEIEQGYQDRKRG